MAYAPELTTYRDASPCPRVEVYFESLHPSAASITVYRSAAGREFEVRGAVRASVAGSLSRIDFECPFNVPVTYRAEMFDAGGFSLGFTDPTMLGTVLEGLPPADYLIPDDELLPGETVVGVGLMSDETWLHNPLDPWGAVRVAVSASSVQGISRPVPSVVSRPRGRSVGVILAEPRQGVSGLRFDVRVSDLDSADRVQALVGGYSDVTVPVICVRMGGTDSRVRLPKPLFLGVGDITEVDVDVAWGGSDTSHLMEGDEVSPPIPGLFIPLLTAADVNAYYATAADLNADHGSASSLNRFYEIAGYATA